MAAVVAVVWLLGQNHLLPFEDLFITPDVSSDQQIFDTTSGKTRVYEGVLPCADCSGLKLNLTLQPNFTYILQSDYIGKSPTPVVTSGTWTVFRGAPFDARAQIIFLHEPTARDTWNFLVVGDNELLELDQGRRKIDAPFNLSLKRIN